MGVGPWVKLHITPIECEPGVITRTASLLGVASYKELALSLEGGPKYTLYLAGPLATFAKRSILGLIIFWKEK